MKSPGIVKEYTVKFVGLAHSGKMLAVGTKYVNTNPTLFKEGVSTKIAYRLFRREPPSNVWVEDDSPYSYGELAMGAVYLDAMFSQHSIITGDSKFSHHMRNLMKEMAENATVENIKKWASDRKYVFTAGVEKHKVEETLEMYTEVSHLIRANM